MTMDETIQRINELYHKRLSRGSFVRNILTASKAICGDSWKICPFKDRMVQSRKLKK